MNNAPAVTRYNLLNNTYTCSHVYQSFLDFRFALRPTPLPYLDYSCDCWPRSLRRLQSGIVVLAELEKRAYWPRERWLTVCCWWIMTWDFLLRILRMVVQQAACPRLLPVPGGHPHINRRHGGPKHPHQHHLKTSVVTYVSKESFKIW